MKNFNTNSKNSKKTTTPSTPKKRFPTLEQLISKDTLFTLEEACNEYAILQLQHNKYIEQLPNIMITLLSIWRESPYLKKNYQEPYRSDNTVIWELNTSNDEKGIVNPESILQDIKSAIHSPKKITPKGKKAPRTSIKRLILQDDLFEENITLTRANAVFTVKSKHHYKNISINTYFHTLWENDTAFQTFFKEPSRTREKIILTFKQAQEITKHEVLKLLKTAIQSLENNNKPSIEAKNTVKLKNVILDSTVPSKATNFYLPLWGQQSDYNKDRSHWKNDTSYVADDSEDETINESSYDEVNCKRKSLVS